MHNIRQLLFTLLWLCGGMLAITSAVAQTDTIAPQAKQNSISLLVSMHDYFDGNAVFERVTRYPVLGLEYARQINHNWGFTIATRFCIRDYEYTSPRFFHVGSIRFRAALFTEANLIRRMYSYKGFGIYATAGLNYRYGEEVVNQGRNFGGEPISEIYYLRDPGIRAGLRLQQALPWNFLVASELAFTQYIWRYLKEWPYAQEGKLSTRNMLTMQIGLGYRF